MLDVFNVFNDRFKADAALRKAARALFYGHGAESIKEYPHVVVNFGSSEQDDGFDDDAEIMDVTFILRSKGHRPNRIDDMAQEIERVFDRQAFTTSDVAVVGVVPTGRGPVEREPVTGVYTTERFYDVFVQRSEPLPPL